MAKLLLITDTHFGVKGNSSEFHDNMELFYSKVFFPYLASNIDRLDGVIHLGDVFHDRRRIDTYTARRARTYFFTPLQRILNGTGKKLSIICGNHDAYFKDTLDTNALDEFIRFQKFDQNGNEWVDIHTQATEIKKWNAVFVPWITKGNRDHTMNVIANGASKGNYLFGHLELNGFSMSKVQSANHGDDVSIFDGYKHILSGHYHYKHNKGNVSYLGSPTEQTWIDVDTVRGFHVIDTENGEMEFIQNPYNIFENVKFGTTIDTTRDHPRHYRLSVNQTEKQSNVDSFIEQLYANRAISVDVIRDRSSIDAPQQNISGGQTLESIEDTPTFIRNSVEDEAVANMIVGYYNRAVSEQE